MSVATSTDVVELLDEALEESECLCSHTPCDGPKTALYVSHASQPCLEGWICRAHFAFFVEEYRPGIQRTIDEFGQATCMCCGTRCYTADEFCKALTL